MPEKLKTLEDIATFDMIIPIIPSMGINKKMIKLEDLRQEAINFCKMNLLDLTKIFPKLSASQLVGIMYYLKWFYEIEEMSNET